MVSVSDPQHCLLQLKTGAKGFRFNAVFDDKTKQNEVFSGCGVHVSEGLTILNICLDKT
jgi:hypothetical protein